MPGEYYHHHYPNWYSSSPSPNKMDNPSTTRPSFPSFMYESPYPPHSYYHPYPSSPMQCCHSSCCHNNHTHYHSPPPYPTPTPHPYMYPPPPPAAYYQPPCCSGGGYPMPPYNYPPPPLHYAKDLPEYEGKGGFPHPWPYPYGSKREDRNVKIEEHEGEEPSDPSNKEDTLLKLVPSGNNGAMNVFPYPWVPSEYMEEDKDKGKKEKPKSLGREGRLHVSDHVMEPPCYYPNPKAFEQEPKGHKVGGWFPLNMDRFGFPWQGADVRGKKDGDQQQEELQKGKKSNQVPLIWMPYYTHPAQNDDDDQAKGRMEQIAETENMRNEQPLLRQSEGSMKMEEDHGDRGEAEKNRNLKIIPVKQIYDEEPVKMSSETNKDADSKKSVDETKRNKESNGDTKKNKISSQKKSSLPPVCLRVDPLPKPNKNGKSKSSPPPQSRKEQKQGDSSLKSKSPLASKEEEPKAGERARSMKDQSNVEQSSKKEIRVTDAVDSSTSQTRIEVSRNQAKNADIEVSKAAADEDEASLDVTNVGNGAEETGVNASSGTDSHAVSEDKDEGSTMPESGELKHVEEESTHEQEKRKKIMSRTKAAVIIQSAYRGYEVRRRGLLKKLRHIAKVRSEAAQLRTRMEALESGDSVGLDFSKEKAALGETIMKLLLELDTIQGLHPSFRNMRKELASELVKLQEKLDSITVNVKVRSSDGFVGETAKLVMENSEEGFKVGGERETVIQKDTSPGPEQVSENGSIGISDADATTNFNSEKASDLVNQKAQDQLKEEVSTFVMAGTGTKVEETEARSVQENEKVHDKAALEFANKDAHMKPQDEIGVLESSSIENHGECNEGELMGGQFQGQDEGDVANAINQESNGGSLVDSCSSLAENEDRGIIAKEYAESPPTETMAKETQKQVEGQDSTLGLKLKESHEVNLLSGLPHAVVDEETDVSPLDIARLPNNGGLDAHKAELQETVHDEGSCYRDREHPQDARCENAEGSREVEMTDGTSKISEEVVNSPGSLQSNVVTADIEGTKDAAEEKNASFEQDNASEDDTERIDGVGIVSQGSTDEIEKINAVTAVSEGEGVLDKDGNHAWDAAFVAEGKDACEENNQTKADTQISYGDGIEATGISREVEITDESNKVGEEIVDLPNSLEANMVAGSSEGVVDKDEDLVSETTYLAMDKDAWCEESNLTERGDDQCSVEWPAGTEVASGSGTSNLQDSSYCLLESRDETEPLSHTVSQHASHEEPKIDEQLTKENKMLKDMIEKLIASGKEQQDVISNLNGKIKELEKKLVKKNTKAKTGKQRPRIVMHTKPSKSALSQISKEGVPSR